MGIIGGHIPSNATHLPGKYYALSKDYVSRLSSLNKAILRSKTIFLREKMALGGVPLDSQNSRD